MTSSAPATTDQVWWRMADLCTSEPVPLAEADLSKPFAQVDEVSLDGR